MNLQRVAVTAIVTALFSVTPAVAGGRADHLMCYKITDTLGINAAVDMIADLQPQFTQRGCTLVKPVEFCVPATKQNVQPPPTTNDLFGQPLRQDYICYLAKCEKRAVPTNQLLVDQFGVRPTSKFQATKVCVPATKFPLRCGTPGNRTCSGACPAGEECVGGAAGCGCQPAQCGGRPDKAGMCGGACPTVDQVCRSSTTASGNVVCACQPVPPPPCGRNPLTGTCGGDCTDPTLKCLPDDAGNDCVCRDAPDEFCAPVVGAPATCGGSCPNPADTCTTTGDTAKPCVCQPGPCHQDPLTGACTGTCDPAGPGGTCHLGVDNQCTCGPPPCGLDPATGQCGGSCPSGELCAPDAANQCGCGTPCRFDTQNVCGGACPPGLVCRVQGQDCTCTQPAACAFGTGTAGVCGGFCPAGQSCQVKQVQRGDPQCLCVNN